MKCQFDEKHRYREPAPSVSSLRVVPHPERECPACDRGERAIVPPETSIFPDPMPVHAPSGNICAKFIKSEIWEALEKAKTERERKG